MTKPKTAAERVHHGRIARMPCIACERHGVSVHHITSDGYQRLTKRHDRVVPLCPDCHQHGPNAIHKIGAKQFSQLHDIDLNYEAERLWANGNG